MPDISMCDGRIRKKKNRVKCERRMDCYRYRAIPSLYHQSYAIIEDECEIFFPLVVGQAILHMEE
jgi:hypothetical protein